MTSRNQPLTNGSACLQDVFIIRALKFGALHHERFEARFLCNVPTDGHSVVRVLHASPCSREIYQIVKALDCSFRVIGKAMRLLSEMQNTIHVISVVAVDDP